MQLRGAQESQTDLSKLSESELFARADTDKDGEVQQEEAADFLGDKHIVALYEAHDADSSKGLDAQEFAGALKTLDSYYPYGGSSYHHSSSTVHHGTGYGGSSYHHSSSTVRHGTGYGGSAYHHSSSSYHHSHR